MRYTRVLAQAVHVLENAEVTCTAHTYLNVAVSSWVIQNDMDTETTAVLDLRGQ